MEPSRQEIQKIWDHFEVGSEDPIALRFLRPKGVDYELPTLNVTFNSSDSRASEVALWRLWNGDYWLGLFWLAAHSEGCGEGQCSFSCARQFRKHCD